MRTGRHEGDWEMVQVALGRDGRPEDATFAQHSWKARCSWTGHVFVANSSHASYRDRGEHGRPWPDPDDEALGDGRTVVPEVRRFSEFVHFDGRWGRSEARWWIPGEAPSPRGPWRQPESAWADPAGWHEQARPCSAGAPNHPWPIYAGLVVVIAVMIGGTVRRLRKFLLKTSL